VLLSLPGSPILYYGDEIGMGDDLSLADRNGVRTPMQWDASPNAGFSTALPEQLFFPVVKETVYGYQRVNVDAEERDPGSLLLFTRRLLELRRAHPAFALGGLTFVETGNEAVLAYTREHEGQTLLVVANFAANAQSAQLDLSAYNHRTPVTLTGGAAFPPITDAPYHLTIGRHDWYWMKLN